MTRARIRWVLCVPGVLAALCTLTPQARVGLRAGERPPPAVGVVISEIQYHPPRDRHEAEFLELENRGTEPVDLSGWIFLEGIRFVFPDGIILEPGEAIVVSPDRAATAALYGIDPAKITGDYAGRLANEGEVLHLADSLGRTVFRVHYEDEDGWPESPDGGGHTLELLPDFWDPYLPESWRASARVLGTPGEPTAPPPDAGGAREIAPRGALWRFWRGRTEPSPGAPLAWTQPDFDDSSWEEGPEPFGFGYGNLGTTLDDMPFRYTNLYTRLRFDLTAGEVEALRSGTATLVLTIDYDDGFVAYLNGVEIGRENVPGAPGDPVPNNARALENRNATSVIPAGAGVPFREGPNTIALQGVNVNLRRDFLLAATAVLRREPNAPGRPAGVRLNEILPGAGGTGFVELFNPAAEARSLEGFELAGDLFGPRYTFPPGTEIPPGEYLVLSEAELPFPLDRGDYYLLTPQGALADRLEVREVLKGWSGARYPDGAEDVVLTEMPTRGAPNEFTPAIPLVITEIHYHPPFSEGDGLEFVEIHNPTAFLVQLAGWRLRGGVRYDFDTETLAPGAYLAVARDPDLLRERLGATEVTGPFEGGLADSREVLRLEDPVGNTIDRVRYADDGSWPEAADGDGPSVELRHPALDNAYGVAWAASAEPGGTPGAPNSRREADPAPRVYAVEHEPVTPRSGEGVTVRCRVMALSPPESVTLRWWNDTFGGSGEETFRDDGTPPDRAAGDGIFSASIPPQEEASTVRFIIEAVQGGRRVSAPGAGRFYLYEVNSVPFPRTDYPAYSILMTEANWDELRSRPAGSDVLLDATFVDHLRRKSYYNVGVRYRGNGSRGQRINYRVQFGDDNNFLGLKRLNFNFVNPERQFLGNELFRLSGLPYPLTAPVSLRIHRDVQTRYVRVEAYDREFLRRFFPDDDDGNLYRSLDGRLTYLGDDPQAYNGPYRKITNEEENDFTDLRDLTAVFTISDPAEFAAALREKADVAEWALYFAANAVMANTENSILLDAGDDYFLYARPSDGRFLLLPWDADSQFTDATQVLFRPSSPSVRRFLTHPEFAPLYYSAIVWLQEGYFAEDEMMRRIDRVADIFDPGAIQSIRDFVRARHAFLDQRIPRALTVDGVGAGVTVLIGPGEEWAYWRGTSDPSGGDLRWTEIDFDDSAWPRGPSGFGYGDGDDATVIDDMRDNYPTVFIRKRFEIRGLDRLRALRLRIDYDDGFVAYLNGTEVASRNWGGGVPGHMDTATQDHEAGTPETIDLADAIPLLVEGTNVLALVGLNGTLDSSDLTLLPILEAEFERDETFCSLRVVTSNETVRLQGFAPACETSAVLVGGETASYDPVAARWRIDYPAPAGRATVRVQALDARGREVEALDLEIVRRDPALTLPAEIAGTLVLPAAPDAYFLGGETRILSGARLVFEAGARLVAAEGGRITVEGTLEIAGDIEDPVTAEPEDCAESWGGITVMRGRVDARGLVLRGAETAIALEEGALALERSVLTGCDTGIDIGLGSLARLDHVTLAGNDVALRAGAGSQTTIENSIVWANATGVVIEDGAVLTAAFSDIQDGAPPGEGNISADPLFQDPQAGDYRLQPGSPAIGAGRGGTDMGAYPFERPAVTFIRGDADSDGRLSLNDAVFTLLWLFQGGAEPRCRDAADADDDGDVTLSDAVRVLNHLFLGGAPPPPPYPDPGTDPTPDALACGG